LKNQIKCFQWRSTFSTRLAAQTWTFSWDIRKISRCPDVLAR
jgi:hypothetical protein